MDKVTYRQANQMANNQILAMIFGILIGAALVLIPVAITYPSCEPVVNQEMSTEEE